MRSVEAYINSVVGTPWVEGETDCYWLVEDSYRELDGIVLPAPPWRTVDGISDSERAMIATGDWLECGEQEGAIIALYNKQGALKHVGRILSGLAVHCDGTPTRQGQCVAESMRQIKARYARMGYTIKYYLFEGRNGAN